MAKGNLFMGYATGKVGAVVLSRVNGTQVSRAYNARPKNPQSTSQQTQRTKLANLVGFYGRGARLLDHSFTNRKQGQSSYNAFVAANMSASTIHLTKYEADNKASVIFPYVISNGSLNAIEVNGTDTNAVTNINLGALSIGEDTTIGALAKAIIDNNIGWAEGDQLTYVSVVQKEDKAANIPYVVFEYFELDLNTSSEETIRSIMPEYAVAVNGGKLAHGYNVGEAGFAWIHSRKDSNGLQCSRQKLIVGNVAILAKYTASTQLAESLKSYNAQADYLLVPDGDKTSDFLGPYPLIEHLTLLGVGPIQSNTTGFPGSLQTGTPKEFSITGKYFDLDASASPISQVSIMWQPKNGNPQLLTTEEISETSSTAINVKISAPTASISGGDKGIMSLSVTNKDGKTSTVEYKLGV